MTSKHPDTGADLTPNELETLKNDCSQRIQAAASELNDLLRRGALLGLEREVAVLPRDETTSTMDVRYNPDPMAWLPVVTTGAKFPFVYVGKPGLLKCSSAD